MNREQAAGIGIGVILGFVVARALLVLTRKESPQAVVLPVPYMPPAPPPAGGGAPPKPGPVTGPVLLTTNPIPVKTGRAYRAIMSVGFPFSLAASREAVKKEAEDLGFADVKVFTDRPLDFPGTRTGDYYLEARWGSQGTSLARPNIPGLSLVEAWEG